MARDAVQVQLEATEARIHTLDQRLTERLDRVAESVDKLASQVVEMKGIMQQILQAIEADREVAKMQATNVQQMVQLSVAQQQTINTLIGKLAA